ncbi:guanylate kinase [Pontimonas salivibrio]|uniref:Guanylate kinase n=1 Tax=Pontimonas salivibrio TaxID=1159327 RepID=A0A2L2BQX2_9MICO|nr:guanylate kinase [Pontimonas salivibrio]AVG24061.1 guanylate kinase [Pontimonas salivibrio]
MSTPEPLDGSTPTSTSPPDRSGFDAGAQSAKSSALRKRRAQIKEELSQLQRDFVDTFDRAKDSDNPALSGLRVDWFLRALPGVGPTKTTKILERLGINPRATIGGLRINQRTAFRRELVELTKNLQPRRTIGRLVVIAGPTAVGKNTVISEILKARPEIEMSVSATTRPPRPGEVDGVDYYFVPDEQFDALVESGELMEWAVVHGTHRYGTPRGPVLRQQRAGKTVLLEIDIQGARQLRDGGEEALFIFIAPPSFDALAERLESRGTEDSDERQRRLATAVEELGARGEFDHVVVNDVVQDAAQDIVDLLEATTPRGD